MPAENNILRSIRMLVTDVDGTLLGRRPEFRLYKAFRERMDRIRSSYRTIWVVCTGRSFRSFSEVFVAMRSFGIVPDYVITRHAYIFQLKGRRYFPHLFWNVRILLRQFQQRLKIRRAIPRLHRLALTYAPRPFVRTTYRSANRLCLRYDEEELAEMAAEALTLAAEPYEYLQVFHHVNEVDMRVVPFTKGLAVTELTRHIGVNSSDVLVIGDGHNDISMMEILPHCRTACPANAQPEVIESVHRLGGHIASATSLAGVVEILDAYEKGAVHSELPEGWVSPSERDNPIPSRTTRDPKRSPLAGAILFLAILYTTLIVLASFDLVPGAAAIRKPYVWLLDRVISILEALRRH